MLGFLGVFEGIRFFPYGAAREFFGFLGFRESGRANFSRITRFFAPIISLFVAVLLFSQVELFMLF
jgi:hypothetical protein